MAVLCSIATGNWTAAATWSLVDATSLLNTPETGGTAAPITAASGRSDAFTPGAITITGIAVKLNARTGTTGTITVELWNNTGSAVVAGTTVTVNASDFGAATQAAADGGWIVFDFANVTLAAATDYMVQISASNNNQVSFWRVAGTNWHRMLLTSTTQAPAAGDDVVVAGNLTGAGTGTDITVTMNETATTDYGSAPSSASSLFTPGVAVCKRGTLSYGTTAATNYYLKVSNSVIVYRDATLNIGTTGTPMPRDSTAVLEFDPAADGDYGLIARNGSTLNIQGLSRTSGKNEDRALLSADTTANLITSITSSVTNGSANQTTALDPYGYVMTSASSAGLGIVGLANTFTDNGTSNVHAVSSAITGSVTNTTQIFSVWLSRATGTNNRFVRMGVGDGAPIGVVDQFFADIDLQAGTIGACTGAGNGSGTSSSIVALGGGFVCTIVGICNTAGAETPRVMLLACNSAGGTSYSGDSTSCFNFYGPYFRTGSTIPDLSIDTDTGWLDGDRIQIASTTRTAGQSESIELAANAGASTLTPVLYPIFDHSGTSPTQAEVIDITRNVKVRSATSTIMAYVNPKDESVVDIDWAEFQYLGEITGSKNGIVVQTTTGSFNMQFSSVHDCDEHGVALCSGGTTNNQAFSNNVMWNLGMTSGPGAQIISATSGTNIVIDSNILIKTNNSNGWTLNDIGGTFTNNTVVSAAVAGIQPNESGGVFGTFSGNTVHSSASSGFLFQTTMSGTVTSLTSWRNNSVGLNFSVLSCCDLIVDSPVLFGNSLHNISFSIGCSVRLISPVLNGDTSFSTINNMILSTSTTYRLLIDDGDFSTVSGIKTAAVDDFDVSAAYPTDAQVLFNNCKFGASSFDVNGQTTLSNSGWISSQRHDQVAGAHKTWRRAGNLETDTTIFNTASPSMRMTPNSASLKLTPPDFLGIKVPVANGATFTIRANVRKSVIGDGAAYNGAEPRLIQRANPALGLDADVVIDTAAAAAGSWEELSGTTSSVNDDGVLEFAIDCDGTAGWVNVDDWSYT